MKYVRRDQVLEIIRRLSRDDIKLMSAMTDTIKEMPAVEIITSIYGMLVKGIHEEEVK